jgi:hypothetical protein
MWYMLPCSPEAPATPFYRVRGALNGSGPAVRAIMAIWPAMLYRDNPAVDVGVYD